MHYTLRSTAPHMKSGPALSTSGPERGAEKALAGIGPGVKRSKVLRTLGEVPSALDARSNAPVLRG